MYVHDQSDWEDEAAEHLDDSGIVGIEARGAALDDLGE